MGSWKTAPWLVIDSETTGLDPETGRIVELAAVWFERGQVTDRRNMLLNPGMPIPAESTAIHGISDADVADKPTLNAVADAFCAHVRSAQVLVGYNVHFDIGFLDAHCPGFTEAREGLPVIDPLIVIRDVGRFWRGKGRHKLTAVCDRFGIELEGNAHRASTDCIATARVLERVLDELSDDVHEAECHLSALKEEQDRRFAEWLARQPKPATAAEPSHTSTEDGPTGPGSAAVALPSGGA